MFLNKTRNIFLCPGHKICVRNKCCSRGQTGKHLCRQQCVRNNVSSFARAFTRVYKCETEEKQHNGITCDLLTAEVIRVVYSLCEDWVISSWVDMKDMDMRNWFATVWSIYFIIILKASRLRRTMKTASTVCATRCLIADIRELKHEDF